MKKVLVLVLICVLLQILDNTLMPFIAVKSYYPSLLFVFMISYSVVNGKWEGMLLGIFCGLLQDLYFSDVIGVNAFANMFICLLAAVVGDNIFKEKRLIPVIASFFLSLIKGLIVFVILFITGRRTEFSAILYLGLYTMVVTIFMYKMVYKLSQKNFMRREWKF